MKDFKTCMKGLWRMTKPVLGRDLVTVLIGGVRIAASLSFVWIRGYMVSAITPKRNWRIALRNSMQNTMSMWVWYS